MSLALLIDFGSTYTKLRALDLSTRRIAASAQAPSTVTTDVNVGLDAALAALSRTLGGMPCFAHRLACSSAAGGLKMVTVGLVRELTAEAARQAALGAGARLVGSFAYRLTAGDVARIIKHTPDILLLCGGTDGGNAAVALHNAKALAASALQCPVIVACNREAVDEAVATIAASGKSAIATANVLPGLDVIDTEPARAAIRDIFMRRIVAAKGIERASSRFDEVLMPTPAAVLEGARLLADGLPQRGGYGPLVVVDPGGATTDVHSIGSGEPTQPGVIRYGLAEPYAKRTVEGDLGMRHNATGIAAAAGTAAIAADSGLAADATDAALAALHAEVDRLPRDDADARLDAALVSAAIRIAMARHAGTCETVYTSQGPVGLQRGKDLSDVKLIIGTGGALTHARDPASILAVATARADEPQSLRPKAPRLAIDREYLLYAAGLLAGVAPEAAFDIASAHLAYYE
ncbi:MAG: methylaspartate mutase accessory protein GlmL [Casimicrobiaceae bacterium]|nr:methylaspartate mutase accessory protein GlmL [Pseudomonadota bacterium]